MEEGQIFSTAVTNAVQLQNPLETHISEGKATNFAYFTEVDD